MGKVRGKTSWMGLGELWRGLRRVNGVRGRDAGGRGLVGYERMDGE